MWWLALFACSETCPTPDAVLTGVAWDAFFTPVTYVISNEASFPAEGSPGNGPRELRVDWQTDDLFRGPVTVSIDGQEYPGTGTWEDVDCGRFRVSFQGMHEAPEGSTHSFAASANLVTYGDTLDGFVEWTESWSIADQVGTFESSTQLAATRR